MKKAPRKYLLTVYILLLTSYGWLYAISNQDFCHFPQEKSQNDTAYFGSCRDAITQASVTTKAVSPKKENPRICYEEREEECGKLFYNKAYTQPGNYFTAFSPKTFRSSFSKIKLVEPSCEHWFYTSSHRFSILRVMRI